MVLEPLPWDLTVCKVRRAEEIDLNAGFFFVGRTDREISLVCRTEETPACAAAREDGWRAFRVRGELDFSLVGILAGITGVLAAPGIGIFAVSTFDTDYILVKREDFPRALEALAAEGYGVEE